MKVDIVVFVHGPKTTKKLHCPKNWESSTSKPVQKPVAVTVLHFSNQYRYHRNYTVVLPPLLLLTKKLHWIAQLRRLFNFNQKNIILKKTYIVKTNNSLFHVSSDLTRGPHPCTNLSLPVLSGGEQKPPPNSTYPIHTQWHW